MNIDLIREAIVEALTADEPIDLEVIDECEHSVTVIVKIKVDVDRTAQRYYYVDAKGSALRI